MNLVLFINYKSLLDIIESSKSDKRLGKILSIFAGICSMLP